MRDVRIIRNDYAVCNSVHRGRLDAGEAREQILNLLRSLRIPFQRWNLYSQTPRHLMEIVGHVFLLCNSDELCGNLHDEDFGCTELLSRPADDMLGEY